MYVIYVYIYIYICMMAPQTKIPMFRANIVVSTAFHTHILASRFGELLLGSIISYVIYVIYNKWHVMKRLSKTLIQLFLPYSALKLKN